MLFPSEAVARRCSSFLLDKEREIDGSAVRTMVFAPFKDKLIYSNDQMCSFSTLAALFYPRKASKTAKHYWQHTGEGISSRRAESFWVKSNGGLTLVPQKGEYHERVTPGRYRGRRRHSQSKCKASVGSCANIFGKNEQHEEHCFFIEERFGRNLDMSFSSKAKTALRRRISGCLTKENPSHVNSLPGNTETDFTCLRKILEEDVYLYPTGMSAIYNTHRILMEAIGLKESIIYG